MGISDGEFIGLGVTCSLVGEFVRLKEGGVMMGILDGVFIRLEVMGFLVGECDGLREG